MIGYLEGKILEKRIGEVLLSVGGVGYLVHVNPETLTDIGNEGAIGQLHTYLAVRENALDLYGFLNLETLNFFELLIKISGVGPKSALSILAVAPLATLKKAISSSDISYLTKVSGIGKKTAEKIVLELRDKLSKLGEGGPELAGASDALAALVSLGYGQSEAREALKAVPDEAKNVNEKIREALKILGKQ